MMKRIGKAFMWLLAAIVLGILTVVFFRMEHGEGGRYRLTVGCGLLTVVCLAAVCWSLAGKMQDTAGEMVVEDIFKMNPRGCVVVGKVQGGFYTGEKVLIDDRNGEPVKAKINGIEVRKERVPSAMNTPAALYFKQIEPDQIRKGARIRNVKD